jgi:peptidoglycan hydrolase CwlO-like protein
MLRIEVIMKFLLKVLLISMLLLSVHTAPGYSNQEQRISSLEKRITILEKELSRLQKQEERASKYLKCVQKVEGNAITVPFKILNCIRK